MLKSVQHKTTLVVSSLTAGAADIKSHGHVIVIIIILVTAMRHRSPAGAANREVQVSLGWVLECRKLIQRVSIGRRRACCKAKKKKKRQENEQSSGTNKK